jgi:hypothetical protein
MKVLRRMKEANESDSPTLNSHIFFPAHYSGKRKIKMRVAEGRGCVFVWVIVTWVEREKKTGESRPLGWSICVCHLCVPFVSGVYKKNKSIKRFSARPRDRLSLSKEGQRAAFDFISYGGHCIQAVRGTDSVRVTRFSSKLADRSQ